MAKKKKGKKQSTSRVSATVSNNQERTKKPSNQWRSEPGVDEPLRVGRGLRTRDNNFKGQKNKVIHPEQPQDELYRRVAVLDVDDDKNVAVVQIKRKNAKNGVSIPQDKQERKYIPDILTLDDDSRPIKVKKGKFELAPTAEDITEKQAKKILSDIESKSKIQKQRLSLFRRNKKNRD